MAIVTIVARLTVRPDAVETVKPELFRMIELTRAEEGCLEYRLHQDLDDPTVFVFYENWKSEAAVAQHLNSEHFRNYVAAVGDLLTEKVVHRMDEISR